MLKIIGIKIVRTISGLIPLITLCCVLCCCSGRQLYEPELPSGERTFDVLFNASGSSAVKTSLDGTALSWSAGDRIGVFVNGIQDNKPVSFCGGNSFQGRFNETGRKEKDVAYCAYYPHSDNASGTEISTSLPSLQKGPFPSGCDFMVADVTTADYDEENMPTVDLNFANHLFGIVKITLTNTKESLKGKKIEAVSLVAPNGVLAGNFNFDVSRGWKANAIITGNISDSVMVSFPQKDEPTLGLGEKHTIYAVVYPGVAISLKIRVYLSYCMGTTTSSVVTTFTKNSITELPVADVGKMQISEAPDTRIPCIFIGDSITYLWMNGGNNQKDPEFFKINNFISSGVGGQRTDGMLSRFDRDVINKNPKSVIILGGINDIYQGKDDNSVISNIKSMVDLAESANIKVILCTIMPRNDNFCNPHVRACNAMLKEYAAENGYPIVDYYSLFVDENDQMLTQYFADLVHPNLTGYKMMESICLPIINAAIGK